MKSCKEINRSFAVKKTLNLSSLVQFISRKRFENESRMTRERLGSNSVMTRERLGSVVSRFSLASLICLCMLTIGVGNAWGAEETLTITRDDVTTANNYGTDSEWEVGTISGKCQIYGTTETSLQFNGGKPNGTEGTGAGQVIKSRRCWNTTSMPGKIKSITITTASGTNRAFRVFCSTSAATSSSTDTYGTEFGSSTTATTEGTTWDVPNDDDTDYRYFMVYENSTSAAYIASIVVTYQSAPAVTYSVTWKSDGVTVHTDAAVPSGTTISTPSDPAVPSGCTGAKFMGWTATENYSHATDAPADLFKGTSPTINSAKTYYAVFADPN